MPYYNTCADLKGGGGGGGSPPSPSPLYESLYSHGNLYYLSEAGRLQSLDWTGLDWEQTGLDHVSRNAKGIEAV